VSIDIWLIYSYIQQIFFDILLKSVRCLIRIFTNFLLISVSNISDILEIVLSGEQISSKVLLGWPTPYKSVKTNNKKLFIYEKVKANVLESGGEKWLKILTAFF